MNLNKIRNINKYQSILRSIFGHVFGTVISEEKKVEMLKYFFLEMYDMLPSPLTYYHITYEIVQQIFYSNRVFCPILQNNFVFHPPKWCSNQLFLSIYHAVNQDVTQRFPKDMPKKCCVEYSNIYLCFLFCLNLYFFIFIIFSILIFFI